MIRAMEVIDRENARSAADRSGHTMDGEHGEHGEALEQAMDDQVLGESLLDLRP